MRNLKIILPTIVNIRNKGFYREDTDVGFCKTRGKKEREKSIQTSSMLEKTMQCSQESSHSS
jgi:hypothetical protein